MYLLYSLGLGLALLLSLPWWLLQMARHGKYRAGLGERLGRVPKRLRTAQGSPTVWFHAVSVGEVLAVSGLIAQMRALLPTSRIVVSTTTTAGQKLARERFGAENVFYFPLDFVFAIQPYLRQLRPELVVLAETEFWPNFLRLARRSGARLAVVNARISDRSFPRYRQIRRLLAPVLAGIDLFLAQSEEDARRLQQIGALPSRMQVSGNLKFDVKPPAAVPLLAELRAAFTRSAAGPILVCGSTVEGEETALLQAFQQVLARFPAALMVLAPRHPERFPRVAGLLAASGFPFWRRSQWKSGDAEIRGGVFLLDSIGELGSLYPLATVAFVGGSLVPRGGHNILEPAQHAVPILVGPHTENFRDIVTRFQQSGALRGVTTESLGATMLELLSDDPQRQQLGRRAAGVMADHSGATARTLAALKTLLPDPALATAEVSAHPVSSRSES